MARFVAMMLILPPEFDGGVLPSERSQLMDAIGQLRVRGFVLGTTVPLVAFMLYTNRNAMVYPSSN